MNKMLRYSFMLLLGFTFFLTACKETEPTDPNQALLANKDWYTDGLYFNVNADGTGGTKVISPNLKLRFSKTTSVNTTTVNDKALGAAAIWTLSTDAKTLTVYYPTIAGGGATLASQALKVVKLTATELWVTSPTQDDIQLFGIITLSPTTNYRFSTTAPAAVVALSEEAMLKASTWTGKGSTNAGIFVNGTRTSEADVTFKFTTFGALNLNYLTVSNLPTPATWILSKTQGGQLQLTIAYPKVGSVPADAYTFNVSELTASKLNFVTTKKATFSSVFALDANAELRLIPQP